MAAAVGAIELGLSALELAEAGGSFVGFGGAFSEAGEVLSGIYSAASGAITGVSESLGEATAELVDSITPSIITDTVGVEGTLAGEEIGGEEFFDAQEVVGATRTSRGLNRAVASAADYGIRGGLAAIGERSGEALKREFSGEGTFDTPQKQTKRQRTGGKGGSMTTIPENNAMVDVKPDGAAAGTSAGVGSTGIGVMGMRGGSECGLGKARNSTTSFRTRTFRRNLRIRVPQHSVPSIDTTTNGPPGASGSTNTVCFYDWSILPNNMLEYYVRRADFLNEVTPSTIGFKINGVAIHCVNSQLEVSLPFDANNITSISDPYYFMAVDNDHIFQNCTYHNTVVTNSPSYSPNPPITAMVGNAVLPGVGIIDLNPLVEWYPGVAYTSTDNASESYNVGELVRDVVGSCEFSVKYPPSPWTWVWENKKAEFLTMGTSVFASDQYFVPISIGNHEQTNKVGKRFANGGDDNVVVDYLGYTDLVPSLLFKPQRTSLGSVSINSQVFLNLVYEISITFMDRPRVGSGYEKMPFRSSDGSMLQTDSYGIQGQVKSMSYNRLEDRNRTEF